MVIYQTSPSIHILLGGGSVILAEAHFLLLSYMPYGGLKIPWEISSPIQWLCQVLDTVKFIQFGRNIRSLYVYICRYACVLVFMCIYIYIYIYYMPWFKKLFV